MKIYIGKTKQEKYEEHYEYLTNWHLHFCWLPVRIGSTIYLFETIYRKGRYDERDGYGGWSFEYRYSPGVQKW